MTVLINDPTVQLKIKFSKIVRDCLAKAVEEFGLYNLEDVDISYDLKGQCAGQAGKRNGTYFLRFNLDAIKLDFEDMAYDTVPHEVAHLVCFEDPRLGKNHNRGWKNVCLALGGSGKRTHDLQLERARKVKRFVYKLSDGTEVQLTKGKHKKVQTRPNGFMYMPAQHTESKKNQPIEKHHFVKMIEVK